jgi:drug/metabolite transporter (DMT)-like permease
MLCCGAALLIISFLFFATALSWSDLNFVLPTISVEVVLTILTVLSWAYLSLVFPSTSLVYVASALGARFILKEAVTFQRWLGIILVYLGVILTSRP